MLVPLGLPPTDGNPFARNGELSTCQGRRRPIVYVRPSIPEFDIAMKACPGPRSGIDCSISLSLVIRGTPSSFRPLDSSLVPKCALQSTSMPALHGRNLPNCRPIAESGLRKCSAGACPPQGSGWGVAESAVPRHNSGPSEFVIPAKAGIHALTSRERAPTAIPPPTSTRRPHFVFPAIARPVPRYGAGIQVAERRHKCLSKNTDNRRTDFHTLVCRWQPA